MSGNAGFTHDPASVFEAARDFERQSGYNVFTFGRRRGLDQAQGDVNENSPLSNVILIERVPDSELERFLSAGDIWIIPYRKNNTGSFCAESHLQFARRWKAYHYLFRT